MNYRIDTECVHKPGLKCPVLTANRTTKYLIDLIRDGRCFAEMCPKIDKLIYNNPWDGFGRSVGYDPESFSIKSLQRRGE